MIALLSQIQQSRFQLYPSSNTVFKGDTYLDPSATVSDLNYLSSQTVTASPANLVTSSLEPQNITYSAAQLMLQVTYLMMLVCKPGSNRDDVLDKTTRLGSH